MAFTLGSGIHKVRNSPNIEKELRTFRRHINIYYMHSIVLSLKNIRTFNVSVQVKPTELQSYQNVYIFQLQVFLHLAFSIFLIETLKPDFSSLCFSKSFSTQMKISRVYKYINQLECFSETHTQLPMNWQKLLTQLYPRQRLILQTKCQRLFSRSLPEHHYMEILQSCFGV